MRQLGRTGLDWTGRQSGSQAVQSVSARRGEAKQSEAKQGKSMQSDECKAQRHEASCRVRGKAATDVDEQAPVAKSW